MQRQLRAERGQSRLGRLGRWFSPRAFLVALALSLVGVVVGGFVPLFEFVGQLAGLFFAGFAVGLAGPRRRYLEVTIAAALVSGIVVLLAAFGAVFLPVAVRFVADYGVAIAGGGAIAGGLVGALGHHFGRDLRDGLTRGL